MPLCSELMRRPKKAVAGSRPERTTPGGSSRAGRGRQYCKLRWLLSAVIGIFQCIFELKMPRPVIWQRFTSTNSCHEPPLVEANPTIAGDEATHGGGAPEAPSRQEGPRGPKKRDRAAADPGTAPGGVPDIADGTHGSAVDHDTTRRRKRRRHPVGPAQAARRHQRIQAYGPQSPQHESLGGCEP